LLLNGTRIGMVMHAGALLLLSAPVSVLALSTPLVAALTTAS
jgi:hypothetical protein